MKSSGLKWSVFVRGVSEGSAHMLGSVGGCLSGW